MHFKDNYAEVVVTLFMHACFVLLEYEKTSYLMIIINVLTKNATFQDMEYFHEYELGSYRVGMQSIVCVYCSKIFSSFLGHENNLPGVTNQILCQNCNNILTQ